jgi:hypothetical protein
MFANLNSRKLLIQSEEPNFKFGPNVQTRSENHEGVFWLPSFLDPELDVNMPQYVVFQYILNHNTMVISTIIVLFGGSLNFILFFVKKLYLVKKK